MRKSKIHIAFAMAFALVFGACHDLDDLNINPNGPAPETTDLNLLMPTFIIQLGQRVVDLGFGDLAGVMQHTQKDGWASGHNQYDWDNASHSWRPYYDILRQVDEFHRKAIEDDLEFHQGVALIIKAYTFGMITDLWGDAPYSQALNAESGPASFRPVFDPQRDIYLGILADLERANTLLSKPANQYANIDPVQDVLYKGNVASWRKLANSLALRYYMRISAKEPGIAGDGIAKIAGDPEQYPLITVVAEDAKIGYIGSSGSDSWPSNMVFNPDLTGEYMRRKICSTLVEAMQAKDDPRLPVWVKKVEHPVVLVAGEGIREIVDGKLHVSEDEVGKYRDATGLEPNYDPEYVGIPPSIQGPQTYNFAPDPEQATYNPHVSHLADIYKDASGPLLQMRLISAAEVHFILAEAAMPDYGWVDGDPATHYAEGIRQSLNAWGVGAAFDDYYANAPYLDLESIMEQKWIASWTAAAESWFDYRRTGLPNLEAGPTALRKKLPLRFYYHFVDEISRNTENAEAAIAKLEPTVEKAPDVSNNSAWSKMWLLQGTGKPY